VSSALPFVAMSVESFGRLGAPALTLLGDLADQAVPAGRPGLSWAVFILGALWEVSVALFLVFASLCRSGAYVAPRASGRTPMRGLARPSTEEVEACFAPRVCVLGSWLYSALRGLTCCTCRVCAFAPNFVSGWQAFSSVSLCTTTKYNRILYLSLSSMGPVADTSTSCALMS
jgi:hypothetical protein